MPKLRRHRAGHGPLELAAQRCERHAHFPNVGIVLLALCVELRLELGFDFRLALASLEVVLLRIELPELVDFIDPNGLAVLAFRVQLQNAYVGRAVVAPSSPCSD